MSDTPAVPIAAIPESIPVGLEEERDQGIIQSCMTAPCLYLISRCLRGDPRNTCLMPLATVEPFQQKENEGEVVQDVLGRSFKALVESVAAGLRHS